MIFPNEYKTKKERVGLWQKEMDVYISNPLLHSLMERFGYRGASNDQPFQTRLEDVSAFLKRNWDYRGKAGGGERAAVSDHNAIVLESGPLIIETARSLGIIKCSDQPVCGDYDYIFPLGGYRAATYDRIKWAQRYCKDVGTKVIALTAHRKNDEIELPFLNYVPLHEQDNCDEFLTACYAVEDVFDCKKYTEQRQAIEGSEGILRTYSGRHFVLCAPTPPQAKRANTLATLQYWKQLFDIQGATKILCITSPIYTSYQMAALAGFAIENDLLLYFDAAGECGAVNKVLSNYLQEIKGTVDAFAAFMSCHT